MQRRDLQRRDFLRVTLLAGGALCVGVSVGCTSADVRRMRAASKDRGAFQPTHFLTLYPDGRIHVGTGKSEMGQGTFELYRLLVAEALSVDPKAITVSNAIASPEWHVMGLQITGGSTSTPESWLPIRSGAAAARMMLIRAAAAAWGCAPEGCTAEAGHVVHTATKRRQPFGALLAAAAKLPIPEDVAPKTGPFTVLGKRHIRADIEPKLVGAPVYGIDVQVDGMVKAMVLRPPVFGGTVKTLDAAAALKLQGVIEIFAFELGVAVVAKKYWQARRAAALVKIEWDHGVNAELDSGALMAAAVKRSAEPGQTHAQRGDVDEALAVAGERTLEVVYTGPYLAHAAMEPLNATVHVEANRVTAWLGTQFQSGTVGIFSRLFGVPRAQVFLHTTFLGGGFGRRSCLDFAIEAGLISKRVGRPVQVIWSREDDTTGGYYRPLMVARMRGALDAGGRPTAFAAHGLSQNLLKFESWAPSMAPEWMPATMIGRAAGQLLSTQSVPNPVSLEGLTDISYAIPNQRVDYTAIQVGVPVGFWRSVGHSVNAFATEGLINELAHLAGQDPVAFRRGLLGQDARKLAVLEAAAKAGDWGEPIDAGWGRGVAVAKSFNTYCAMVIEAGIFEGQIRVRRVSAAIDCGTPINLDMIEVQVQSGVVYGLSAAIWQKIDLVNGRPQQSNFHDYHAMRMSECPPISVAIMPSTASPSGVGEPGLPPVAPALAEALYQATGKRLRSMPFADHLTG